MANDETQAPEEGATVVAPEEGETTGRRASDPVMRKKRADARVVVLALVKSGKLKKDQVEAIELLLPNLESQKAADSRASRVLAFVKAAGEDGTYGLDLFKEFYYGTREVRQYIFELQDEGEWISAEDATDDEHKNDTLYRYVGKHDLQPEDYPGPIRRSRAVKS